MEQAYDTKLRCRVEARNAISQRGRYRCIGCNQFVSVRGGGVRERHFFHLHDPSNENCRYFRSVYSDSSGQGGIGKPLPPRPLPLFLSVTNPGSSNSAWYLELGLPQCSSGTAHTYVRMPAGLWGPQTVWLEELEMGGKRVPVRCQREAYHLALHGQVTDSDCKRMTIAVPGLAPVTAFRYSEHGGRRIDSSTPLYWGRGYYLVWHEGTDISWPTGMWRQDLASTRGWRCTVIELPTVEDEDIEDWIRTYVGYGVERPAATISLVAPVLVARHDDGTVAVEADVPILVGISGEHGSAPPQEILVHRYGESVSAIPLDSILPTLVSLGCPEPGTIDIWLPGHEDAALCLRVEQVTHVRVPQSVNLEMSQGEAMLSVPLISERARKLVNEVSSLSSFRALRLPMRVPVTVEVWSTRHRRWSREYMSPVFGGEQDPVLVHHSFEATVSDRIRDLLASQQRFRVDVGPFGSVEVKGMAEERQFHQSIVDLDPELRGQLKWLVSLPWPTALCPSITFPRPCFEIPSSLRTTDAELIRRVCARRWEVTVATHLQEVANRLTDLSRS